MSVIKFDLSDIPSVAAIDSAELRVFVNAFEGTIEAESAVCFLSNSYIWTETGVTYSLISADFSTVQVVLDIETTDFGYQSFTGIDGLVQNWVDGTSVNNGMVLKLQSIYTIPRFVKISGRSSIFEEHVPHLLINYTY